MKSGKAISSKLDIITEKLVEILQDRCQQWLFAIKFGTPSHFGFDVRHSALLPRPSDEGPLDYCNNVRRGLFEEQHFPSAERSIVLLRFADYWNSV